jgi:ElaB/YqjD/DUF883 family membrane-anchored ribosome-binding protein
VFSWASNKPQIADTHRVPAEKTRAAAWVADGYVHQRPWASIAVGAGAGLLLGLLLARRWVQVRHRPQCRL